MTLKEWRLKHRFTQAYIARRLGKNPRTVRAYENGEYPPSDDIKKAIDRLTDGAVPISVWFLKEAAE